MTEELRRRLRYLQHLPITCQFEVAEIQLKPPIVSKETIDHFQGVCALSLCNNYNARFLLKKIMYL